MLIRKAVVHVLFFTFVSVAIHSQPFKSLAFVDKVSVPHDQSHGNFSVQLPMKCGADGTIYIRFAGAGSEPTVTLIRDDGKIASEIRLRAIPEFTENTVYDFAPGNGDVLVLSAKGKPHTQTIWYVSRFKTDGSYVSSVKVETGFKPDFEPLHIAAFPSGDLLIAGITKGHKGDEVASVPFVGIFGADGEFQRQLVTQRDVGKEDVKHKASDKAISEDEQIRNLLEVSYLQTGDDGNAYLMRHTPSGPVFVVSPGGVVRRVALVPPVKGADLQWIVPSGGVIAAQYRSTDPGERKTHYLTVVDSSTSTVRETIRYLHDYQSTGGGMACYQHGTFTFIAGAPDNKLQLVKAIAQ
ncbi:MAG TPA: hypothetical protein VFB28_08405 [Terriglobales bacterium]|nr:hypothetical protein [Terriglobales bacterium]